MEASEAREVKVASEVPEASVAAATPAPEPPPPLPAWQVSSGPTAPGPSEAEEVQALETKDTLGVPMEALVTKGLEVEEVRAPMGTAKVLVDSLPTPKVKGGPSVAKGPHPMEPARVLEAVPQAGE